MVLDAKVMEWATQQGLDTAALKKAKIPIYGKWYFPDLPADTPLVNMRTGAVERFPPGYRAGAILYVREEDLRKSGLGPYKDAQTSAPAPGDEHAVAGEGASSRDESRAAPTADPRHSPWEIPPEVAARLRAGPTHAGGGHAPAHHAPDGHDSGNRGPSEGSYEADLAAASHGVPTNEHAHPTSAKYVQIAIILAVITAGEVALYYIPNIPSVALFWILMALSAIKFFVVAAYFMHLKFDHTSFSGYFAGGLALAIAIFLGLLALTFATKGAPTGF